MPVVLPPLPYADTALEPYISAETLRSHHGKHHKAYVDKVNTLTEGTSLADADLEAIIQAAKAAGDQKLLNQAGQAWNHDFFWMCLTPGGGKPASDLATMIDRDFGSFGKLQEEFETEALEHFGSGWAWLVLKGGKLAVTSLHDGDCPVVQTDVVPLLTCDVWEHAYYLDYRSERPRFVQAFLQHLANWDFAAVNLARAQTQMAA